MPPTTAPLPLCISAPQYPKPSTAPRHSTPPSVASDPSPTCDTAAFNHTRKGFLQTHFLCSANPPFRRIHRPPPIPSSPVSTVTGMALQRDPHLSCASSRPSSPSSSPPRSLGHNLSCRSIPVTTRHPPPPPSSFPPATSTLGSDYPESTAKPSVASDPFFCLLIAAPRCHPPPSASQCRLCFVFSGNVHGGSTPATSSPSAPPSGDLTDEPSTSEIDLLPSPCSPARL